MDIDPTAAGAMVSMAFAAKNQASAMETQTALLRKTLDAQQAAALQLLKSMGIGQNLNAVG
jgi:hypothetical protein